MTTCNGRSTAFLRLLEARHNYAAARRMLVLSNQTGAAKGPAFQYLNKTRRELKAACAFARGGLAAIKEVRHAQHIH